MKTSKTVASPKIVFENIIALTNHMHILVRSPNQFMIIHKGLEFFIKYFLITEQLREGQVSPLYL